MRTALTELPKGYSLPPPPPTATRESTHIDLKAGLSTIHYMNVKVKTMCWGDK